MRNPYKRQDLFTCKYPAHVKFEYKVSAYHVLRVKNCYPQGCLYFKWKCQLLNNGKRCIKGFRFVGKKCFGCHHFFDEKINHSPDLMVPEEEYHQFLDELEDFEDWFDSVRGKEINFWGLIRSVKPRITKVIHKNESSMHLEGYLLHFDDAYLNTVHWEDRCYAIVYADQQERYQFAPEDDVEFKCRVELDQGRLIYKKIRNVDFRLKSDRKTWTNSTSLVAKGTATLFNHQELKCLHCDHGVLVDVVDKTGGGWERRRELYCLESFPTPDVCYRRADEVLQEIEIECP